MATPLLGWISPKDRTQEQNDAHARALAAMPKFHIAGGFTKLAKGEKIILSSFLKDPRVVKDIGSQFWWFHQLTGSCVGASLGNMMMRLIAVQRCLSNGATKAFLIWWLFNYGRTRTREGDRGQGEGAIDSEAARQLIEEGVLDYATTPGLPKFQDSGDGLVLTSSLEMRYSDGSTAEQIALLGAAKIHPLGAAAVAAGPQDIYAGIVNGYPTLYGCDDYVGGGSLKGSGDTAYVVGRYDGRGGHSTGFDGVWEHPNDGTLYHYQNNWPKGTYPTDPSCECPCGVWLPESEVQKIWTQYSGTGETFVLSHLNWFPSQPDVLNWIP